MQIQQNQRNETYAEFLVFCGTHIWSIFLCSQYTAEKGKQEKHRVFLIATTGCAQETENLTAEWGLLS